MTVINIIYTLDPVAVLAALILHFAIGMVWYHPSVFGKTWKKLRNGTPDPDLLSMVPGIAAHVVYTLVLALFIKAANAETALDGFLIGMLVAVGFIGTIFINELTFTKMPVKLFLIKFGDEVVSLSAAGILLALWR